jgi:phage terminase large subunit-like protein
MTIRKNLVRIMPDPQTDYSNSTSPLDRKLTGADVINWIEGTLYVPEGKWTGRAVKLTSWQKREILRIYDNPVGTRRAILSFGRKNGKTAFSAFLLLLHLCGPAVRANSSMYSSAQSREQAAIIFRLAAQIVRMSPVLRHQIQIKDGTKELLCRAWGTRYRALSAEASTAYGLSPVFVVHDELGQVRGPRSPMYEALETATGAQEEPLSVVISTQAPTANDLLSILIDDALGGDDPRVICSLYTAPDDEDPFDEETIKKANPAFGEFLNPKEVLAMAQDAKRMPAREPEYRNLVLNQRVEALSPFVATSVWKSCSTPIKSLQGLVVYGGLDLSEVRDLTALVLIGNHNGTWHVHPTFWLPSLGLENKARTDRIPYDLWRDQGFLRTTPGRSISYEFVAAHLRNVFSEYKIGKLAFDRWNMRHLRPWLLKVGFTEDAIDEKFVDFGQGTQSMSPALRDLESLLLDGKIAHGGHPVLGMCATNSVVEGKDGSNRKLSKARSSGRIDGMVALAMAIGVAPMPLTKPIDIEALIG